MTLEIRQLVIKSTVGGNPFERSGSPMTEEERVRFREDLLAEFRSWFREQMRLQQER